MTTPAPVYDRAPSRELQELLHPDGFLSPIAKLAGVVVGGHYHDVHFRTNNEVHVYRGLTRLITVTKPSEGTVRLTAHSSYRNQPCAQNLLRSWSLSEPGLNEELDRYLLGVKVSPSFLLNEGSVQEQWSRVNSPWVPFDREGVLGGPHQMGRDFPQVQTALDELTNLARVNVWPSPAATGSEIDQLAIDPAGNLVLLELKDASSGSTDKVYYSPFQLLQYVWEWDAALEAVRDNLQAVINARVAVGLTPTGVPQLHGRIRAAVGFGPDNRSDEVKRRYQAVLNIVNRHVPRDVGPIETWAFTSTGPSMVK